MEKYKLRQIKKHYSLRISNRLNTIVYAQIRKKIEIAVIPLKKMTKEGLT